MTSTMLLSFLTALLVLIVLFIAATLRNKNQPKWLGILVVLLAAPFFYWFGLFSSQFNSGICYSDAISSITAAVEHTRNPKELSEMLKKLPLEGYETDCKKLKEASSRLPGATAP